MNPRSCITTPEEAAATDRTGSERRLNDERDALTAIHEALGGDDPHGDVRARNEFWRGYCWGTGIALAMCALAVVMVQA